MTLRRLGPPRAWVRALLRQNAPFDQIAEAAAACFEERTTEDVIGVLLPLLRHPDAAVRAGACRGLAAHPYPVVERALYRTTHDKEPTVRQAAEAALDAHEAAPLECIQCGSPASATLTPEPSSDPHGVQVVYPAFCSTECAVVFALDRARDEHHRCAPDGRWHFGPEAECGVCQDFARLGEDIPLPPEPPAKPPAGPRRRRKQTAP